jgi:enoyl-[acyl-carrier protein] reductase I
MLQLLENKVVLIMGVRNKWSIAWGIAQQAAQAGARLVFTYQGEREREALDKLLEGWQHACCLPCDVTDDAAIDTLFQTIRSQYGVLHGVVHAIAYARSEDLTVPFTETSRDGFLLAMNVSAYSFIAVARAAAPLMTDGGSLLTLTYHGSNKVMPGYNVMGVAKAALESSTRYLAHDLGPGGIRVNAISAGPVKTMSAKGVKSFGDILDIVPQKAPLRRNVTLRQLGGSALYLLSDMSEGVTGEIHYVDSGFSTVGI